MKHLKFLSLGLCLISGVAMADPKTEMMQDKLDRLEAEMALIQRKIYQQPQQSNQPVEAQTLETPKNIDDFYTQIDAQNQIIQDLTAQLEQTNHRLADLTDKFNRMQQDVEFRFQNLNQTPVVETAPPPQNPTPTMPEITDKEAYDKAYAQLKDGKYDQAEQSFLSFMETYPNSSLLGNANYWLAETYYARSKWAEASGLFADGFTKHKDNIKAPDSMFKLGMTMKQMGKNKEACAAFKGLAGEFKNLSDNLKKRSEQEIKDLKCP